MLTQENIEAINRIIAAKASGSTLKEIGEQLGCTSAMAANCFCFLRKIGVEIGAPATIRVGAEELAEFRKWQAQRAGEPVRAAA